MSENQDYIPTRWEREEAEIKAALARLVQEPDAPDLTALLDAEPQPRPLTDLL